MRHKLILLLLVLCGFSGASVAQKNTAKVYVAKVTSGTGIIANKRDRDEITFQAKNTIKELEATLNMLTDTSLTESERTTIIENCYLPNQNKLFLNDAVVIEDDIDPRHRSASTTADLQVDRYLRDLGLFYVKTTPQATIAFTQQIATAIQQGKEHPYIKVFFLSTFKGKRSDSDTLYQPNQRVAELRPEKVDGKWRTYITRLAFPQPGEGVSELTKPIITALESVKLPAIKGDETTFRRMDGLADSLLVKWDQSYFNVIRSSTSAVPVGAYQRSGAVIADQTSLRITLTDNDQQLAFTRIDNTSIPFQRVGKKLPPPGTVTGGNRPKPIVAWLQIVIGAAAITASVIGYSSIRSSYDAYTTRLSAMNAEYAVWQTLSQQQGVSPAAPMSFSTYAQPGIYGVYGGTTVGSGLIINGVRQLLKINKLNKQAAR
ncbi:hypothetical protein [Spirosoma rhododendri]|uniref:Uncharacterized protein n=1 Tax=Spirosoma rhododendri TaxID=2728024 RepID=A0A7L5DKA5_9BACT|nr:hypothetical protein [Spirosoma rhododendri]QJD78879.1 hypothetical protein HH216_10885 [Spirosoma rhododendri]